MISDRERLKVGSEPRKLRIDSEPFVLFVGRKFAACIDIHDLKKKRDYFLIIEAQSLSMPLLELMQVEGQLTGLEVWVNKKTDERTAPYELSLT